MSIVPSSGWYPLSRRGRLHRSHEVTDDLPARPGGGEARGGRGRSIGQATGRSKVTRRPSTPPGPTRPLTSADVMAFTIQPFRASSFRISSSLSAESLPPTRLSRSWTTRYSNRCIPPRCQSGLASASPRAGEPQPCPRQGETAGRVAPPSSHEDRRSRCACALTSTPTSGEVRRATATCWPTTSSPLTDEGEAHGNEDATD
jgi:hypothetical protein